MKKMVRMTTAILLLLGSIAPIYAQRFYTSLPKYFEIDDANEWSSQQLTFEKAIEGIRITVFETNTANKKDSKGYPIVGISEIDIMDTDGNEIAYSATANSVNNLSGNGLAGLNDNDLDGGYYQSAQSGSGSYVYIELTFDKPQSAFIFKLQRCSNGDNFPLQFTLSSLGNEANPPFNPSIPPEPGSSQDDVAGRCYNIVYMVDGKVFYTESLPHGNEIVAPEAPEKEGYTFSGWSEVPETMPSKDVTVSGSFTVNTYTVTYMVDGELYKTESYAYGSVITAAESPAKEGYTFSEWSEVPSTMPAKNITVNGSFTVNSYTVTYIVDGEVYKTESITYGSAITAAESPVKEGYTFSEWSEVPETMPAKNITVNGSFTVNSYTVTYIVDGEMYKTESIIYGSVITVAESPVKEGYTFSGWSEVPETMPAKDVTVSGSFTVNSYTVTYVVDGELYKTESYTYGSVITVAESPVKEGYTFSGWNELPETMPAKDITVSGNFTINSYTVTYIVDGEVYKTESITYGSAITVTESPVKEGYTFSGWNELPETMPSKDVTVSGSFTVNTYTVTYMVDGELYKTESYAYGSVITAAESPVKEGYTFSEWSEVPETMPAKNITVNGSFTVNSYTVTYIVDGEMYKTESIIYGSVITVAESPVKEGYTFSGWSEVPETMPAKDITVSGSFTVNSYTITYVVDGEVYKTESIAYGSAITAESLAKEGYTFSGWSEVPETMPANDVIVTGSFTVNSYTITYIVDGEEYKSVVYNYGENVLVEDAPIKEGHTFSGWDEVLETMPAENITITGSFAVNSYTVTFILEGVVFAEYTLPYGSAIEIPEAPEKEGLSFSGWGKVLETMPAKDLVYEGSYMNNPYTIIYMVDGEEYYRALVEYGSAITLIATPTKEGYTFSGWSEVSETMPAKDVTVSGSFTVNSYTITYVVDGEVYKTESIAYGSAITAADFPVKEGHTFSGWNDVLSTMPAKDITISGSFTVNTYTVTYMVDGELYKTENYTYGSAITAAESPVKEGYTFSGWNGVLSTMPAKDITISGSFTVNTYTVTYMVDGEVYKTENYTYGSAITAADFPVKEGHTFSGWNGVLSTMPAKDITVSGSFTINTYTVTYMVDGEVYKTENYTYGSAITVESPAKEGYTFSGWNEIPETMPAHDVTIEGYYVVNSYNVVFIVDGEVINSESLPYGSEIVVPEVPEKEGYTFNGWNELLATVPAHDVTFEGSYTVNSYSVTFIVDGEVIYSESLPYGSEIVAPKVPEKEGHTFNGWGEVEETVPANDVTFEGTYSANIYKVYYYVGEELVYTAEVAYGDVIPEYVYEPTEGDYTFLGWEGDAYETMPAHDVYYIANTVTTGVEQLRNDNEAQVIYDLTGRKVIDTENLKGGIYIVNGKKVLIK